jgi:curved DNA-binding protein CbpA
MDLATDAYKVLQVDASAELCVIQAAYRALARRCHPDGEEPDPNRMAKLNAAYAILRDAERRRIYDVRRTMHRAQAVPTVEGQRRVDAWVPHRTGNAPAVLDFGRYVGWSIRELVRIDPDYLRWLCRHSSGLRFRDEIMRVLPREDDLERRANSVA